MNRIELNQNESIIKIYELIYLINQWIKKKRK